MNTNYILAAALLIVGILYLLRRRSRLNKED
jgi:LPXTG-motif cell wall-anchored protein